MLTYFTNMQAYIAQLRRDDRGATMVEYGLLVALIAVVVAVTAATLGDNIAQLFQDVADSVAG
jgi:pilus assembly protein Flp/PilA